MTHVKAYDPTTGALLCAQCGGVLMLCAVYILNHLDPRRACIEFLPVPIPSGGQGLALSCILDGPEADERGVIGVGIDENGVKGEEVYGDYNASIGPEDRDKGVLFEMRCNKCDADSPGGSSTFEIRFEGSKTKFYGDGVVSAADPPLAVGFGDREPVDAGGIVSPSLPRPFPGY